MQTSDALEQLIKHRESQWNHHCQYVLQNFLLPAAQHIPLAPKGIDRQSILLIENRINDQWLFTVLNSWLMAPKDSSIVLICDRDSKQFAHKILQEQAPNLPTILIAVEDLSPQTDLKQASSFNAMMKQATFWAQMPSEKILVIQTDALLAKPLHPFFFNFSYLGAPFLPRQHTEYFFMRDTKGQISRFFKTDSPIHGSPNRDVYPHLHGNGGLSIRSKTKMHTICEYWGESSPECEAEDVFFSRHINKVDTPAPLEVAQAFATETTYNPNAIGSHACWKFLDGPDLAHHFEQHLRETWAMTTALKDQAS